VSSFRLLLANDTWILSGNSRGIYIFQEDITTIIFEDNFYIPSAYKIDKLTVLL
jgi:hypothetical protein